MSQYLIKRLLQGIPVIIIVSIGLFVLVNLAPGGPVSHLAQQPGVTQEDIERRFQALGLDAPLHERYITWAADFIRGDFGTSMDSTRQPVIELIRPRVIPTIYLTVGAMILAFLIAIPVGILSATKQYSIFDYGATVGAFLGISVPNFFLGLILLFVFALRLDIMPTGGFSSPLQDDTFFTHLHHAILPVIALGTARAASLTRYMRSSMLEAIGEDYVRTARSKGLKERMVIFKHTLRNALIPVITLFGLQIPLLFSGAVITEEVFSWPGIGRLTIGAVHQRNYTVILATSVIFAVLVFAGNFLSDVLYTVVDPRIKYD